MQVVLYDMSTNQQNQQITKKDGGTYVVYRNFFPLFLSFSMALPSCCPSTAADREVEHISSGVGLHSLAMAAEIEGSAAASHMQSTAEAAARKNLEKVLHPDGV